ncbi:MAG TPA: hypothetical protein VHE35_05100 [Kofleriaceae bacterium]|nr:hypothetical protein [Kofleriaceae bacterium]
MLAIAWVGLAALAEAGLAETGCGGAQHPAPPRSTCADAAASIVRALRVLAPADGERAAELEPRFADTCRTSGWRPGVIRCFALARDPDEDRVCARRLEPDQRDKARLIQGTLYGPGRAVVTAPSIGDNCRGLIDALEVIGTCPTLPPTVHMEMREAIQASLTYAATAAASRDPQQLEKAATRCQQLSDMLHNALVQVGC